MPKTLLYTTTDSCLTLIVAREDVTYVYAPKHNHLKWVIVRQLLNEKEDCVLQCGSLQQ